MSKTVIVFSTYYNYPVLQDKLFNKNSCYPPKEGGHLKFFFFKRLKEDKENPIWASLADYFNDDQKKQLNDEINSAAESYIEQLKSEIKNEISIVNQLLPEDKRMSSDNIDDPSFNTWIIQLKKSKDSKYQNLIDLYRCYMNNNIEDFKKNYLRETVDLTKYEISNKGSQLDYDIYCSSADIPEEHPWLYNRISYYKLKASNDEVSIYAVWPLSNSSAPYAKDEDGTIDCDWIEALKKQFFSLDKDCKTIYFCLHAKDLFGSNTQKTVIYKSYGPNKVDNKNVVVILFQHPKPIGELLSQNGKNAHDVLEFIQKETLKLGLIDLKSTVNPSGISRTRELLEFYHNYDFCRTEVEDIINKLTTYECADENIKYQLGKEIKMSINHIGDKI